MGSAQLIATLFGRPRALIAMIHAGALPGTPRHQHSMAELVERAVAEAELYRAEGADGLILENMHDRPYVRGAGTPEIVAAMSVIAREVRRVVTLPLGIQVLAGANREAIAVAHAAGASFVRVEGFVFGHLADEGWIESSAGDLLRFRRAIGAEGLRVFADIKKKHAAHAVTADVSLVETARAAEFFLADGVIVSGAATGEAAQVEEVEAVSGAVTIPTLVGSGLTAENLSRYRTADGFIVGSSLKQGGLWSNPVDRDRVRALRRALDALATTP